MAHPQSTLSICKSCQTCSSMFFTRYSWKRFCSEFCAISACLPTIGDWYYRFVKQTETCWLWTGRITPAGYGAINLAGWNGTVYAHRVALYLASGEPLPPRRRSGAIALHTCDIPACVRNDDRGTYEVRGVLLSRYGHLAIGTMLDNMRDRDDKGRGKRGKPNPPCGGGGQTKITADQVALIHELYNAGEIPMREIAERTGVSRAHAKAIVAGKVAAFPTPAVMYGTGKAFHLPRRPLVSCKRCGKSFRARVRSNITGRAMFCSNACRYSMP